MSSDFTWRRIRKEEEGKNFPYLLTLSLLKRFKTQLRIRFIIYQKCPFKGQLSLAVYAQSCVPGELSYMWYMISYHHWYVIYVEDSLIRNSPFATGLFAHISYYVFFNPWDLDMTWTFYNLKTADDKNSRFWKFLNRYIF